MPSERIQVNNRKTPYIGVSDQLTAAPNQTTRRHARLLRGIQFFDDVR